MRDQIGRYQIRRELRRGGMATVYLAFDPRIRRQVAIKVLPRQFTHDPKYLARFEQEAQMIATLEHPAIVPVYDFGEQDDAPYLVMRYMSGGTLGGRLQGEPLSLEDIAAALDRLAPALDYAHEVGVIHRDLKPANILFDHQGSPYLADFGIARLAEASQTMTIIGTPAYMSPEQVESQVKLDGRSDIYALGVMLYELLAGKQPYTAETPTGQMLMHITMPVPDIMASGRDLPPGTQGVIEKAMAKDREERYQSAAELATAVNDLLAADATAGEDAVVRAAIAATAVETVEETAELDADDPAADADRMSAVQVAAETTGGQPTRMEPLADAVLEDAAEKVLLYTPPEKAAKSDQKVDLVVAAAAAGDGGAAPPVDARGEGGGGLPGWIWWVGALALVAIAVFGIRAVLSGGDGEEAAVALPVATPTEDSLEPEVVAVTRVVTETVTEEVEVTRVVEVEGQEETAAEPVEEPTETPVPTVTPTKESSHTSTIPPALLDDRLGETRVRPADGMTMVYVPEGSFPMGSEEGRDNEMPVHEVSLDAFWIDRTEVTNSQFAEFVEVTGHETTAEEEGSGWIFTAGEWKDTEGADWQHPQGPDSDLNGLADHPAVLISWFDAELFCEWAHARLPTEAEWEYAARGPEGLTYPWGDSFDGEKANFCDANCPLDWADENADDGYEFTAPAGSYPAGESWSGALDMAGNVAEWVSDWYYYDYYANSPGRNPQGPASSIDKAFRWGSWRDGEFDLRGTNRGIGPPDSTDDLIGFRCVVSPSN